MAGEGLRNCWEAGEEAAEVARYHPRMEEAVEELVEGVLKLMWKIVELGARAVKLRAVREVEVALHLQNVLCSD